MEIDPALISKIEELFSLEKVLSFQKVGRGFLTINHILQTESGDKYFLKQHRNQNFPNFSYQYKIMFSIQKSGVPAIIPLLSKENKPYFLFNESYYSLFPFADGDTLENGFILSKHIQPIADLLVKIHGSEIPVPNKDDVIFNLGYLGKKEKYKEEIENLIQVINNKNELDNFDTLAQKILDQRLNFLDQYEEILSLKPSEENVIHGDFLVTNMFFTDAGEIKNIFDFELSGVGSRYFEMGRFISISICNFTDYDARLPLINDFLLEYNKSYPIDIDKVCNALKFCFYKYAISTWIERSHYLENNTRTDKFLMSDKRGIDFINSGLDDFVSKIKDNFLKSHV